MILTHPKRINRPRARNLRLTVDNIAKAYGYLWALKDIRLELRPGDLVALLGPNGAGKTTLLKLLAGLIAPTTGSILIDGQSVTRAAPLMRGTVGMLAPAEHLYEHLTVKENLLFFLKLYHREVESKRVNAALTEAGLADRADDYVGNLSSGLKCRVSIAKWQLLELELLLLDEPYGVLDGSGVDLLETFLARQCATGRIVIMASHHVSRVLNLCNRALILHRGRLTFNEVKQEPWTSFERAFKEFLPRGESWGS
jgi:heme ABC exporter ATP-binding subunit CcmA